MGKQQIDIPHTLTAEEVRARLDGASGKLKEKYGAICTWQGERALRVTRTGFDGLLRIDDSTLHLEIELSFLLRAVKDKILGGITRELASLLAPAPSGEPPPSSASSA